MNNKIDISVRYNLSELLLPFHVEDLKTNNIYKGKTLTELKEIIRTSPNLNKSRIRIRLLMHVTDVNKYISLLNHYELEAIREVIEGDKYVKKILNRDEGLGTPFVGMCPRLSEGYKTIYYAHVEDLKTNNIYKGKTLTEIKEYLYYDKKMEKEDSLIPILIYIRNIKDFLNLLTKTERDRLEEILEETKDSEPLEEWMFS